MKFFKTIFIALTLLLTLGDAHTHQNRRGYRQPSRRQAKPQRRKDHLMNDLHHAALHGDYNQIERLLQTERYKRKINDKNNRGQTPLHLAALKGHLKIIKILIEKGADVNAQKNKGETALNIVVTQKHKNIIEIIKYLFLSGADITLTCTMPATKDKHEIKNISPLHAVLLNNQPFEIIQTLVEFAQWQLSKEKFKTFINAQMNTDQTALNIAINQGQKETIKYLLEKKIDITLTYTMPATKDNPCKMKNVNPLHATQLNNQPFEIIQLLVEHAKKHLSKEKFKKFINAQMSFGDTALHIAITQGLKETIKYLLKNNADITLPCIMPANKDHQYKKKNVTSLHLALLSNKPLEITELLVEHAKQHLSKEEFKTFINAQMNTGQTALHIAVTQGKKEMIKYLLENGANPNIQTAGKIKQDKIRSPFQLLIRLHEQSAIKYENQDATRYSSKELCELIPLFLEHGARINLANKFNQTPLYWIIPHQLTNELKVLIENSTQKNNLYEALKVEKTHKKDEFGKTIWETLEIFYNPEIIEILVDTKNKDGKTLIDIAREQNDQEVFVNLQNYRAVLDTDHYLRFRKVYPSLSQKRRYPDKEWFFGMINTLETQNRRNRPTIEIKKREKQEETTEKTYQLYKHNNYELRFDVDAQTLEYRNEANKDFKTMRSGQGYLLDEQVTMFDLRHPDNQKFYYWYQNNKLKFRQSGTQQTYNLKLKS